MKNYTKQRLPKILIVLVYAVCCLVSYLTNIGCIWQYIFGIPCPGCGFTHAVISAVKLDFAGAFAYHPMFWSFPVIVFFFLFGDRIKSKVLEYVMIAVLLGFLAAWIYKLCNL